MSDATHIVYTGLVMDGEMGSSEAVDFLGFTVVRTWVFGRMPNRRG